MEYNNPYQSDPNRAYRFDGSFDANTRNKKRRGSDAGCFLLVFFSIILIAAVIGLLFQFIGKTVPAPSNTPNGTHAPNETVAPGETISPNHTPYKTTRPLPTYDGSAPEITDTINPFSDIYDFVRNGVVSVCNYVNSHSVWGGDKETLKGTGTGFVISSDGYILTNAHVVEGADFIRIVTYNDVEIDVEVIGYDLTCDVAVLKMDNTRYKLPALKLGNSSNVRVGEFVITIGDPSGIELAGSTSFGIISAASRSVNIDGRTNEYIQTDAAMNPGNSGGPLINTKGEVIGINSAKTVTASYDEDGNAISAEGLGFAIPINNAMRVAEQLISSGYIQRPGIGLSVKVAKDEVLYNANLTYGLSVEAITSGGPADDAGLKVNDIIIKCEGVRLDSTQTFVRIIQNKNVGDTINVTYYRNGQTHETTITIGDLNLVS